jgi:chemotaxis protein methyltransferase CheR
MNDAECVQFLQEILPQLGLRWAGFRKVRRIVCKRIDRRLKELGLSGIDAYRDYLESHPAEWKMLDAFCRIPISRFYRDRGVFQFLEQEVFPRLSEAAVSGGESTLRCWSLGCASGEEPYTLAILWKQSLASRFPTLAIQILATDVEPEMIARAERGCYPLSSLKELPEAWRKEAFIRSGEEFCVKPAYREPVTFLTQDIREEMPKGPFHLIHCRNLLFTYFDEALQRQLLRSILDRLAPGGAFVIGRAESLPEGDFELEVWSKRAGVYRRVQPIRHAE